MKKETVKVSLGAIAIALALPAGSVNAQIEEVIVTARKRQETSLQVPITLQAFSAEGLARNAVRTIDDLARFSPGLIIGEATGSISGGNLYLRGIGSGESNVFIEQAVAFNVDGMPISRASVRRLGFFDLERVEILKGPQSLYWGRNTTGGLISLVSADPTSSWESQVRGGYEVEAAERFGEGYISGPITENLGLRIAAYGTDMDGWIKNDAVPSSTPGAISYGTQNKDEPGNSEWGARVTLKYTAPTSPLTIRLKGGISSLENNGIAATGQLSFCPLGQGQTAGQQLDNCKVDHHNILGDYGPVVAALDPLYRDGVPYLDQKNILGVLSVDYDITPYLSIASITGYYSNIAYQGDNFVNGSLPRLPAASQFESKEFSQEVRFQTTFDAPINFMLAAQYSSIMLAYHQVTFLGGTSFPQTQTLLGEFSNRQNADSYSVTGSATWNITKKVDLTAGLRWTRDKKSVSYFLYPGGVQYPAAMGRGHIATATPEVLFVNVSPEATLSYHPTEDINLFASYKTGFKSGGFDTGFGLDYRRDVTYRPEKVQGPEFGVKARITPNLRVDASVYAYKVTGLQITRVEGVTQKVFNAAGLWTKGAEINVTWTPPQIEGLTLTGGAAYDHARYSSFLMDCWGGQTPALGCNQTFNGANFTQQNLAGKPALRAPDFTANAGFDYKTPLGGQGLELAFGADATYSSEYYTDARNIPGSLQRWFTLVNANVRLSGNDNGWQVALIGKNLGDELYAVRATQTPFTPATFGTPGTTARADIISGFSRGREIILQLTIRPHDLFGNE